MNILSISTYNIELQQHSDHEIVELKSNGRISIGCYLIKSKKGETDKILKVSHFDESLLELSKDLNNNNIVQEGSYFLLPSLLNINNENHKIFSIYKYQAYENVIWANLRNNKRMASITSAIAEMNGLNCQYTKTTKIREKLFTCTLTKQKLSEIFDWSNARCDEIANNAQALYSKILLVANQEYIEGLTCLCHNDLVPSNIGRIRNFDDQGNEKYFFLDLDNACKGRIGMDLRFLILANYRNKNILKIVKKISSIYSKQFYKSSDILVNPTIISLNMILGYADAWINIHRRARSNYDKDRLIGCIKVCNEFMDNIE